MSDTRAARTRTALLNAASQIVLHDGVNQLTLEAVAAAAGVSKGGLLYHFPSKEALIEGMIAYYIAGFEARIAAYQAQETHDVPAVCWLRAYIRASFADQGDDDQAAASLLGAIGVNPALLTPLRDRYAAWQALTTSAAAHTKHADVIRFALDGLWVSELLDLAPPDPAQRAHLMNTLLAMTEEKNA